MFGYIIINKDELKIKDFNLYRSFYCGLCQELKREYGSLGQLSLSFDMTFLILLLTGLYEAEETKGFRKCIAHPFEKHPTASSRFTAYGADMNLLLTYYKCLDDWDDEKKRSRYLYAASLKKRIRQLELKYPEKTNIIAQNLQTIRKYEQNKEYNLDLVAGCFGTIMAELFACQEDEWADTLRAMGFFFGKFIYLMDAYEDLELDLKKGTYNPFFPMKEDAAFESNTHQILTMMMAECCRAFERLPILNYTDILRNILYSGVWSRYEITARKRKDQTHGQSL